MKKNIDSPTQNPLIVIAGATASGKTELSLALAKKFNGEIIIADARQLNRGMDIGTNKPTRIEQRAVKHHLIDITTPASRFTAHDFQQKAYAAIADIQRRGKLPLLVGGTGLYIKAVVDGLDFASAAPDAKLRKRLEKLSLKQLNSELKKLDPLRAKNIDTKNPRRLIRAIEIVRGARFAVQKNVPHFSTLQLAPQIDREELYTRINDRVLAMLQRGLEKEVRALAKKYAWDLPAMSGIGYREFAPYFAKKITRAELIEEIQKHTRHYAKRQLTWFKADPRVRWVKTKKEAERLIIAFLEKH